MNWLKIYRDPAEQPPVAAPTEDATKPGSATITTPVPAAKEPLTPASTFSIPDTYKDRPWLKDVDSVDKLLAKADGAMKLVGTRPAGIPAADAKPEEWEAYYKAIGRPDAPSGYQLEGADKSDPKITPLVLAAFHKAGLTPAQAKEVWTSVRSGAATISTEQQAAATKANDDAFTKLATDTFGATQRDAVLATSKGLLDQFAPAAMKPMIANMSNENLILMAGVLNNIHAKYIKEDGAPGGQPTATAMSPAEVSMKARELMSKPEYRNPMLPGHDRVVKEVTELYDSLRPKR